MAMAMAHEKPGPGRPAQSRASLPKGRKENVGNQGRSGNHVRREGRGERERKKGGKEEEEEEEEEEKEKEEEERQHTASASARISLSTSAMTSGSPGDIKTWASSFIRRVAASSTFSPLGNVAGTAMVDSTGNVVVITGSGRVIPGSVGAGVVAHLCFTQNCRTLSGSAGLEPQSPFCTSYLNSKNGRMARGQEIGQEIVQPDPEIAQV